MDDTMKDLIQKMYAAHIKESSEHCPTIGDYIAEFKEDIYQTWLELHT